MIYSTSKCRINVVVNMSYSKFANLFTIVISRKCDMIQNDAERREVLVKQIQSSA